MFKQAALNYGAVEDNEYPDLVLINHGIDGVDNTGALNELFKQQIISMVQQLESNNANIIGIACNTAHTYLDDIDIQPDTTLVNLIDAVAQYAASKNNSYLLLTSGASKKQKLYHKYLDRYNVSYQETTTEQQELLDKAIGLVMAYKLTEAGELMDQVIESAKKMGHNAVIAGCTELPIAIDNCQKSQDLIVINSNQILAKALLEKYYQTK